MWTPGTNSLLHGQFNCPWHWPLSTTATAVASVQCLHADWTFLFPPSTPASEICHDTCFIWQWCQKHLQRCSSPMSPTIDNNWTIWSSQHIITWLYQTQSIYIQTARAGASKSLMTQLFVEAISLSVRHSSHHQIEYMWSDQLFCVMN